MAMAELTPKVEGRMDKASSGTVVGVPAAGAPADEPGGGLKGKVAALLSSAKETAGHVYSQMKPWSEFVQRDAFSKPEGFSDAISKIRKNIRYFKFNYLTLTFGVTALTFVRDPGSLSVLIALAAMWFYLLIMRKEPLKINGRQLGQREQVLGAGAISFLVVFFLSSVGSELMYALFLSSALVAAHGSFRVPDELFLEEDVESAATLVPPTTSASLQSAMAQIGITAASS